MMSYHSNSLVATTVAILVGVLQYRFRSHIDEAFCFGVVKEKRAFSMSVQQYSQAYPPHGSQNP